ncbi:MAG: hypothetical protein AAGH78_08105 [Cyanobacteria bacterium P01_H01_bin.58]
MTIVLAPDKVGIIVLYARLSQNTNVSVTFVGRNTALHMTESTTGNGGTAMADSTVGVAWCTLTWLPKGGQRCV